MFTGVDAGVGAGSGIWIGVCAMDSAWAASEGVASGAVNFVGIDHSRGPMDAYVFDGFNYNFNTSGGTRSISGTVVRNCFVGTAASVFSGANPPYFDNCEFGTNTVTVPPANFNHCEFNSGVITLGVGNTDLIDCASIVAGSGTPLLSRSRRGRSTCRSGAGPAASPLAASPARPRSSSTLCPAAPSRSTARNGTVNVRGMVNAITDNRTGTPTLNQLAALNRTVLATPTYPPRS